MSIFYCGYHECLEDSDYVGYNDNDLYDSGAVCDRAMWILEEEEYQFQCSLQGHTNTEVS